MPPVDNPELAVILAGVPDSLVPTYASLVDRGDYEALQEQERPYEPWQGNGESRARKEDARSAGGRSGGRRAPLWPADRAQSYGPRRPLAATGRDVTSDRLEPDSPPCSTRYGVTA
jgi:hypothetical protein